MPATKPASPVLQSNQYATGLIYAAVMAEGEGTTLHDLSSSDNNGTCASGSWSTGQFGGPCLNIAGSSANIVALSPFLTNASTSFSVSVWVYFTAVSGNEIIACDYQSGAGFGWALEMDSAGTGKVNFYTDGSSSSNFLSTGTISTGSWHNIIATFASNGNGGTLVLYIDGALDSTHTVNTMMYGVSQLSAIGGLNNGGSLIFPITAKLDAVFVYNFVLPLDENPDTDSVTGINANPFRAVRPQVTGNGAALLAAL